MTCSVHVLAAPCSELNVAVSTVDCNLEHKLTGVLLSWWKMPVTDLPLTRSWHKSASQNDVTVAGFPFGLGAPKGISSFASAQQECNWDVGIVRCVSPDLDCSMAHLGKMPMASLDAIQVSSSWHCIMMEA